MNLSKTRVALGLVFVLAVFVAIEWSSSSTPNSSSVICDQDALLAKVQRLEAMVESYRRQLTEGKSKATAPPKKLESSSASNKRVDLPRTDPIDNRMSLPNPKVATAAFRQEKLEEASTIGPMPSTVSTDVHPLNLPSWFPGLKWGTDFGNCNDIYWFNDTEVTSSMRRFQSVPVSALKVITELLYVQRGRQHLDGLDIGPLHSPHLLPRVKSFFVDWRTLPDLRANYTDLLDFITDPDYVDTAEHLKHVADNSMDVVTLSHVFEHTRQTLRALRNILRVTKKDGIIYMAVPNTCISFDHQRLLTTWRHHVEEWFDDDAADRNEHEHHREYGMTQWAVGGMSRANAIEEKITSHANKTESENVSIHYHTWSPRAFLEYLLRAQSELKFPFVIQQFGADAKVHGLTIYAILRRL